MPKVGRQAAFPALKKLPPDDVDAAARQPIATVGSEEQARL
jgi:hypothetical protein